MNSEILQTPGRKPIKLMDSLNVHGLIREQGLERLPFIPFVDQDEGAILLNIYLRGQREFYIVLPFLIREAKGDKKIGSRFFIGGRINGKVVSFALNPATQGILREGGTILAFPHEDEDALYRWINFHEVDRTNMVDVNNTLQSFRIDTEKLKMERWLGLERQIFLDYLGGRAEIDASMLREFSMNVSSRTRNFHIGTIGEGRNIWFEDNNIPAAYGQEINFRPRVDEQGTSWLEIAIRNAEGQEQLLNPRLFHKGNTKLYELGELPIPTEQANEQLGKLLGGSQFDTIG